LKELGINGKVFTGRVPVLSLANSVRARNRTQKTDAN